MAVAATSVNTPAHAHASDITIESVSAAMAGWLAMVAAMMFPLVTGQMRAAAFRSLWRRRHRAIGTFLLGYVALWLIVGMSLTIACQTWPGVVSSEMAAIGFVLAAAWQRTPIYRKALRACHRERPLAPGGWRAERDCLRYGWSVGASCAITCWPVMMACALARHHIAAMIVATILTAAGRIDSRTWSTFALKPLSGEKAFR